MKIKFIVFVSFMALIFTNQLWAESTVSTNGNPVGLETNILFNATNRYKVTQSGPATINLKYQFDGNFRPSYSATGPSNESPQVILIENLPGRHRQRGAWIGFTTRYWPISHFKLEIYNIWDYPPKNMVANTWITIADYSSTSYASSDFISELPYAAATKIRLTIYSGSGPDNRYGLSEIYFLHPEAGRLYSGLIPSSMWELNGNVGIGTKSPKNKLDVKGTIHANEIVVDTAINATDINLKNESWADYVFREDYILKPLTDVEDFIKENNHLPDVPSAEEIKKDGLYMSVMMATQMKKIEELTLHLIEQNKHILEMKNENDQLKLRLAVLEKKQVEK